MLKFAALRPAPSLFVRLLGLVLCITAFFLARAALAGSLHQADRLLKTHHYKRALAQVDAVLAAKPGDPQARFLKGVILTEAGDSNHAIAVFKQLTEDYPELPEPYNNLAVIYASQGRYELARTELERALRTHPSYATAYENLGDIYAKMASEAYDKALQIDSSNSAARSKLALLKRLTGTPPVAIDQGRQVAFATRSPTRAAPEEPVATQPTAAEQSTVRRPAQEQLHARTTVALHMNPATMPKPTVLARVATSAPREVTRAKKKAPHQEARPDVAATEREILDTVKDWAKAWSHQNVARYLSFYAKNFETPHGESRDRWERIRRERLSAPKSITVGVESPKVRLAASGEARVTFRQTYETKSLHLTTMKMLVMENNGGQWLIRREQILR